jgi:hypothetical protein
MDEKPLRLYTALKIGGLRNERRQKSALKKYGYRLDERLSDGRQTLVAFNKNRNQVLFLENGTDPSNPKDLYTDLQLARGQLITTDRYRESKQIYDTAKSKYKGAKFLDVGYSLGGALVNEFAQPQDKAVVFNSPFLKSSPVKKNVSSIRVANDPISLLSPPSNTRTLVNPYENPGGVGIPNYLLKTHSLDSIKEQQIFL